MHIIIVGCGKVGKALVEQLSDEGNNVTIVDTNKELVRYVSMAYDVLGVTGNGASYQTLLGADLEHADLLIAVTESDELNLLCCLVAKQKTNCHTIARVRNPVYSEEREFIRGQLKLSMTINPEYEAAKEIFRLLRFPKAIDVEGFSKDRIELLRFKVPASSCVIGRALKDISQKINRNVLICIAERDEKIVIPNGDYVVEEGDILSIIAQPGEAGKFFQKVGLKASPIQNALLIGGGGISYYLTDMLLKAGISVKIIERSHDRCEELNEMFPRAVIDCADGTDRAILEEEHLENVDAFVSCTGIDEINAVLSLYAQQRVRTKVVTKMNRLGTHEVIHEMNLESIVNPKQLTAQRIVQYVRAMGNSILDSNVETLYKMMDDQVEALEFIIKTESKLVGRTLADMKFLDNVLIAGIVREGKLIIPGGSDSFEVGDSVIVVTTHQGFDDISDILDK